MARHFKLTADGGSRGNPGPAGYGAVVSESGKIVAELFDVIGVATNNVAEYNGLLAGLSFINKLDAQATVEVHMDSKLVVEQMSGRWQIKHADMRNLAKQCRDAHNPTLVTYAWIPRDENSHADRLANKALDGEALHKPATVVQQNFLTDRLVSDEVPTLIYLVRHGETVLTPFRKFSGVGPLNPELTDKGLDQAGLVAAEVAKLGADALIASPQKRTQQTAKVISQATGLEIVTDPFWQEVSFGDWDGKSIDEVKQEPSDSYQNWLNSSATAPPNGESYDHASLRIEQALEKLVAEYPGKKIIVVAHNGVIKCALKIAIGGLPNSVFHIDINPCSISSISIWPSDGLRAIRSVNERSHLK